MLGALRTSSHFFLQPLVPLQVLWAPVQVPGQGLLLQVVLLLVGLLLVGLLLVVLLRGPKALLLPHLHFRWQLLLQYKWQLACEFLLEVQQLQVER